MQISDTSSTEPKPGSQDAKLPVHVLMLPPGSHAFQVDHRKPSNADTSQPQVGCDLIDQRWLHRERNNNESSGKNLDISFYTSDDIGPSGAVWIGASPLEIAMIDCCTCDEGVNEVQGQWDSANEMVMKSRTRLKRHRDEEDDYLPSDEEDDRKLVAQVNEVIQNRPKFVRGSLIRGRELHFLSIMARFCNTLSDRSLSLAILARTVQADKDEEIIHKRREYLHQRWKQGLSSSDTSIDKGDRLPGDPASMPLKNENVHDSMSMDHNGSKEVSTPESTNDQPSSVEYPSPGILPIPIMTTFLTSGGMKVLNQWLQEAFTPTVSKTPRITETVSAQSSKPSTSASSTTANIKKRGSSSSGTTEVSKVSVSRTCTLLPVILKLLQDIPFHKALVYETQINKQIRKLKKMLDKAILTSQTEPNNGTTGLDRKRDPIFGSLHVVQVLKAVDSLMTTWKEAVALSNKGGGTEKSEVSAPDPFSVLRKALRERFQAVYPNTHFLELKSPQVAPTKVKPSLSVMENKVEKGSNIPNQKSTVNKIQTREEELKAMQARLDAQRKIMELHLQKMTESSNKMAEEVLERKSDLFSNSSRRVTWADSRKGMLVEVREYIIDSFNHGESSHDFTSEKREERRLLFQNERPSKMHLEDEEDDDDFFL